MSRFFTYLKIGHLEILINEHIELIPVNNVIHDCWFDLDNILSDSKSSVLNITFQRELHS